MNVVLLSSLARVNYSTLSCWSPELPHQSSSTHCSNLCDYGSLTLHLLTHLSINMSVLSIPDKELHHRSLANVWIWVMEALRTLMIGATSSVLFCWGFIYSKGRERKNREGERDRGRMEREKLFCIRWFLSVCQAEAEGLQVQLQVPHGWQETKLLNYHLLLPRMH